MRCCPSNFELEVAQAKLNLTIWWRIAERAKQVCKTQKTTGMIFTLTLLPSGSIFVLHKCRDIVLI